MNRDHPDLAIARDYIEHGTPVFVRLPKGWQRTMPDPACLDRWQPGWAVCAVTGVTFDVIDVDPRDGGDASMRRLLKEKLVPPVYGVIRTPSGGMHLYVAKTDFRKCTPLPGIDYQAGDATGEGRGFVFIPPTQRVSKADGVLRGYEVAVPIDWDALGKAEPHQPWMDFLESLRKPVPADLPLPASPPLATDPGEAPEGLQDVWDDSTLAPEERRRRYFDNTVAARIRDLRDDARRIGRNKAVFEAACRLGNLEAGFGYSIDQAKIALVAVAKTMRDWKPGDPFLDDEIIRALNSGIKKGRTNPDTWSPS